MKKINLDIELLLSSSGEIKEVEEIITDKRDFKGFKGRFSSPSYDLYAAFKVNFKSDPTNAIWIVFGEGWKYSDDYIYVYDLNKNEIIEKILSEEEFKYRQKPSKRDGLNDERKEKFILMNGEINFNIAYPKSYNGVKFFLNEVQNLALIKVSADDLKSGNSIKSLHGNVLRDLENNEKEFEEGGSKKRLVNTYERNPKLRTQAIRLHGLDCLICGFNFEQFYGELGKDFIEVHHIIPLSKTTKKQIVDPKSDLVCVCSNCHRMLHRDEDEIDIYKLKEIINKKAAHNKK